MSQIKSLVYRELVFNLQEIHSFFQYQASKFDNADNIFANSVSKLKDFCNSLEIAFLEIEELQFILTADIPVISPSFRVKRNLKDFELCEKRLSKISEYLGKLIGTLNSLKLDRTARIISEYYVDLIAFLYLAAMFV
jgi:hypothetical protein